MISRFSGSKQLGCLSIAWLGLALAAIGAEPPAATKLPPAAEPAPKRIQQDAKDGSLMLPARHATVHGKTLRYEPEKNTLGYWTDAADWASWDVQIAKPGTFLVEALAGCPQSSAGSRYTVEIGDQKLSDNVQDTGSFHNFRNRKVGTLEITKPGDYTLAVRPETKPGLAVMDLRTVTLTPLAPAKPEGK